MKYSISFLLLSLCLSLSSCNALPSFLRFGAELETEAETLDVKISEQPKKAAPAEVSPK